MMFDYVGRAMVALVVTAGLLSVVYVPAIVVYLLELS